MKTARVSISLWWFLLSSLKAFAFEETLQLNGIGLKKSGEGSVRILSVIKVFEAAFYLEEDREPSEFPGDFPYALSVRYTRDVKRTSLIKSAERILKDLHGEAMLNELKADLETINNYYQDVKQGDTYTLAYKPDQGTTLLFNKIPQVTIPGEKFAEIYFSIWLGDHPDSRNLRRNLLES